MVTRKSQRQICPATAEWLASGQREWSSWRRDHCWSISWPVSLLVYTVDVTDNAIGPASTHHCLPSNNKFIVEGLSGTLDRSTDQPVINAALSMPLSRRSDADRRQRRRHVALRPRPARWPAVKRTVLTWCLATRPHTTPRKLISDVRKTWKTSVIDRSNRRLGPN